MSNILDRVRGSILFVVYGGGHAAALAPVARMLIDEGHRVEILALTTAAASFRARGLKTISMVDLTPYVPEYVDAPAIGDRLAADQPSHHAVSVEETRAYLGVGYKSLEAEFGKTEAQYRYTRLGRQAFIPRHFFGKLFALARPAIVVATSAPRSERAAIEAASKAEIPSLCLVDLYAPFEIEWCAAPGFANRICVLNNSVAERFRLRGVPEDRVVVTGNPAFDRLGDVPVAEARSRHRAQLGLNSDDRLIVWISQPEPQLHPFSGVPGDVNLPLKVERELAAEFANDAHIHLVMRLHPSEDRPPEVTGPRIRYGSAEEPLDDLLSAADCLITTSSTVGLEAGLLGVPVVQLTTSIFSPDLPLGELQVATAAPSFGEAVRLIRESLENQFSSGNNLPNPIATFDATMLVTTQITQLLNERVLNS